MKQFLLYAIFLVSATAATNCLSYYPHLPRYGKGIFSSQMFSAYHETAEQEISLEQEIEIYALIVGIYSVYWLKQKA